MGSGLSRAFKRNTLLLWLLAALCLGAACDGSDDPRASVIIGVTSDFIAGSDLARLDVVMIADGETVRSDSVPLGASAGRTTFPTELSFDDVADQAALSVTITGYDANDAVKVVRHVETKALSGPTRLVRVHLEALCRLDDSDGGGPSAPTCNEATETCISGQCRDAFIDPARHEPYAEDWAESFSDACKAPGGGEPIVTVGRGMSDYFAAEDYELAEVEAGPQGGHHIWIATRVKNLHRSGSITEVGGEIPSLGLSLTPLKVIFTMDPDEGGYCKLYGLRFQLDIDGDDINSMLGAEVRVIVTITDSTGDVGQDDLWLTLSDYII